jgi:hypothetical protein
MKASSSGPKNSEQLLAHITRKLPTYMSLFHFDVMVAVGEDSECSYVS